MKKKILICGAGGFIGGHLALKFIKENEFDIVCADIKPKEYWFQIFDEAQNFSLDLKEYENTLKVTKDIDYIFNFACNMGGMGFIVKNFFSHQVPAYIMGQNKIRHLLMA